MSTADLGEFFRLLTLIQIIPALPGFVLDISSSVFNLDVEITLSLLLEKNYVMLGPYAVEAVDA